MHNTITIDEMRDKIVDKWIRDLGSAGRRDYWQEIDSWSDTEIINFYQQLDTEDK